MLEKKKKKKTPQENIATEKNKEAGARRCKRFPARSASDRLCSPQLEKAFADTLYNRILDPNGSAASSTTRCLSACRPPSSFFLSLTLEVARVLVVLVHVLRDGIRPHQQGRRDLNDHELRKRRRQLTISTWHNRRGG